MATYRDEKDRAAALFPNVVMPHPLLRRCRHLLAIGSTDLFRYRFLRVTRKPTHSRPHSGRVLVENVHTGERQEFYSDLFGINWSN